MFDRTKSTIRYLPPNGTAGFARSRVNGCSRVPCPPAIISANVLIYARLALGHAPHGDGARTRGKFRARLSNISKASALSKAQSLARSQSVEFPPQLRPRNVPFFVYDFAKRRKRRDIFRLPVKISWCSIRSIEKFILILLPLRQ